MTASLMASQVLDHPHNVQLHCRMLQCVPIGGQVTAFIDCMRPWLPWRPAVTNIEQRDGQ